MRKIHQTIILLFPAILFFILFPLQSALSEQLTKAPSWQTKDWINLPEGSSSIDVQDFEGKVIYLSFFQKW